MGGRFVYDTPGPRKVIQRLDGHYIIQREWHVQRDENGYTSRLEAETLTNAGPFQTREDAEAALGQVEGGA